MSLSLYQASVPVFNRFLGNLTSILYKTATHAQAGNIDHAVFLRSRLFPDMFDLGKQIQRASNIAAGGVARIAGIDVPVLGPDTAPASFADAIATVQRAQEFLSAIKSSQVEGREEAVVSFIRREQTVSLPAETYLLTNVIPNFYFHLTTAYDLLRHNGVEIGKQDFLGRS